MASHPSSGERFISIIWKRKERKERFEIHRDKGSRFFLFQIYSLLFLFPNIPRFLVRCIPRGEGKRRKKLIIRFLRSETIENRWKRPPSRPTFRITVRESGSGRKFRVEGNFYEFNINLRKEPRKGRTRTRFD